MPSVLKLEDFAQASITSPNETKETDGELAAFDRGYQSGWDDAQKENSADQQRASTALNQALQDLSFTYVEARSQILQDIRTVIEEMIKKILPRAGAELLSHKISEHIEACIRQQQNPSINLETHPSEQTTVDAMLAHRYELFARTTANPELLPGQVRLTLEKTELEIGCGSFT